ncbi:hypothetical protein ACO1M4_14455, partial [Staphylococcus aureus]
MQRLIAATAAIGLGVLASVGSAAALTEAAELEQARANARAGGPVSARDAEFLDRWGCLSGTQNAFCQRQKHEPAQSVPRR